MRLTLRTLLAWLDDTLPPTQVREIGRQVSESTYAQELVERINRVTRQRRLTVPSRSGPDGTDPNLVASYVDNDLGADEVAEYEKKCLGSDVNLAEAACVHQILSLLGQKVQVPPEARTRMYQLVKGRESTAGSRRDGGKKPVRTPVTEPIQPWVAPPPPPRHWLERYGPVAGCLALVGLLCWSAYQSLTPSAGVTPPAGALQQPAPGAAVAVDGPAGPIAVNASNGNPQPTPSAPTGGMAAAGNSNEAAVAAKESEPGAAPPAEAAGTRKDGNPAGEMAKPAESASVPAIKVGGNSATAKNEAAPTPPARAVPAGSVGVVDQVNGLLLRYSSDKREWERVADGTPLGTSDRLLCLEPFRARIVVGKTPITLFGETLVAVTSKTTDEVPAFDLSDGRALIDASAPTGTVKVGFAGLSALIDRPSHAAVGLERVSAWHSGQPSTQPPPLAIHVQEGEATVALAAAKETLAGPGTLVAEVSGRFQPRNQNAPPAWLTATELDPQAKKLSDQFLDLFSKDRPVLADTVLATESDSPAPKKLAIQAVKALGDLSFLTPILSRAGDRSARQSTIAALRAFQARGATAAKVLRASLAEEFGEQTAQIVEKLLVGYSADEAAKRETQQRLVDLLSPRDQSLAVRELALDNLKTISGRDDLGYDPDNPEEKGYNAWKSLLNKDELKPAARRK